MGLKIELTGMRGIKEIFKAFFKLLSLPIPFIPVKLSVFICGRIKTHFVISKQKLIRHNFKHEIIGFVNSRQSSVLKGRIQKIVCAVGFCF